MSGVSFNLRSDDIIHGLQNVIGENNCFLNVLVQALWHLAPFREGLKKLTGLGDASQTLSYKRHGLLDALCDLFVQFEFSDEFVLPATELREALGNLSVRFKPGSTADANEAFDAILQQIHEEIGVDCPTGEKCLAHSIFGGLFLEQFMCKKCGATNEPDLRGDFIVGFQATEMITYSRKKSPLHPNPLEFGKIICKCLQLADRQCPANDDPSSKYCNGKASGDIFCLEPPVALAFSVGWMNTREETAELETFYHSIALKLRLADIYPMHLHSDPNSHTAITATADASGHGTTEVEMTGAAGRGETKAAELGPVYNFRGMVCYYGAHYTALFHHHSAIQEHTIYTRNPYQKPSKKPIKPVVLDRYVVFDDGFVKVMEDWEAVKLHCIRSAFQPVLLLYEADHSATAAEDYRKYQESLGGKTVVEQPYSGQTPGQQQGQHQAQERKQEQKEVTKQSSSNSNSSGGTIASFATGHGTCSSSAHPAARAGAGAEGAVEGAKAAGSGDHHADKAFPYSSTGCMHLELDNALSQPSSGVSLKPTTTSTHQDDPPTGIKEPSSPTKSHSNGSDAVAPLVTAAADATKLQPAPSANIAWIDSAFDNLQLVLSPTKAANNPNTFLEESDTEEQSKPKQQVHGEAELSAPVGLSSATANELGTPQPSKTEMNNSSADRWLADLRARQEAEEEARLDRILEYDLKIAMEESLKEEERRKRREERAERERKRDEERQRQDREYEERKRRLDEERQQKSAEHQKWLQDQTYRGSGSNWADCWKRRGGADTVSRPHTADLSRSLPEAAAADERHRMRHKIVNDPLIGLVKPSIEPPRSSGYLSRSTATKDAYLTAAEKLHLKHDTKAELNEILGEPAAAAGSKLDRSDSPKSPPQPSSQSATGKATVATDTYRAPLSSSRYEVASVIPSGSGSNSKVNATHHSRVMEGPAPGSSVIDVPLPSPPTVQGSAVQEADLQSIDDIIQANKLAAETTAKHLANARNIISAMATDTSHAVMPPLPPPATVPVAVDRGSVYDDEFVQKYYQYRESAASSSNAATSACGGTASAAISSAATAVSSTAGRTSSGIGRASSAPRGGYGSSTGTRGYAMNLETDAMYVTNGYRAYKPAYGADSQRMQQPQSVLKKSSTVSFPNTVLSSPHATSRVLNGHSIKANQPPPLPSSLSDREVNEHRWGETLSPNGAPSTPTRFHTGSSSRSPPKSRSPSKQSTLCSPSRTKPITKYYTRPLRYQVHLRCAVDELGITFTQLHTGPIIVKGFQKSPRGARLYAELQGDMQCGDIVRRVNGIDATVRVGEMSKLLDKAYLARRSLLFDMESTTQTVSYFTCPECNSEREIEPKTLVELKRAQRLEKDMTITCLRCFKTVVAQHSNMKF